MAGLRIIIKAALPAAEDDVDRLCLGVNIHIAVAAAVLLACVVVTAYVIPYLVDKVQQTESPEVPPGRLNKQLVSCSDTCYMHMLPEPSAAEASTIGA
jgi:hypothetical protein